MNEQDAKAQYIEEYNLGIAKRKSFGKLKRENKHGIANKVTDLNIYGKAGQGFPLSGLEAIPDHTYIGNTSGQDASPAIQDLGINTHFYTKDNRGITVVNGLITQMTTTSTSSSISTSSSSTKSTSSSSSVSSSSSSISSSSTSISTSSSSISETTSSSSST